MNTPTIQILDKASAEVAGEAFAAILSTPQLLPRERGRFLFSALLKKDSGATGFRWRLNATSDGLKLGANSNRVGMSGLPEGTNLGMAFLRTEDTADGEEFQRVNISGEIENGAEPNTLSLEIRPSDGSGEGAVVWARTGSFVLYTRDE